MTDETHTEDIHCESCGKESSVECLGEWSASMPIGWWTRPDDCGGVHACSLACAEAHDDGLQSEKAKTSVIGGRMVFVGSVTETHETLAEAIAALGTEGGTVVVCPGHVETIDSTVTIPAVKP